MQCVNDTNLLNNSVTLINQDKPNFAYKFIFTLESKMMNPNIGVTDDNRMSVANESIKLLADQYVLYTKTRNAHWNIGGIAFYNKHKFFETQFGQLDDIIDSVGFFGSEK